jgi:hypothetical protein
VSWAWPVVPGQSRSDALVHRARGRVPENIVVEAILTIPVAGRAGGAGAPPGAPTSQSVTMSWSMVKLPEKPMMARLFDQRTGYFSVQQLDYSRPEQRAQNRQYIVRWRLEKKDPNAAVSEPVKADHVLRRPGDAVVARPVREAGHRGLAARVRGRRFPPRHRGGEAPTPGAGSRLVAGGRALLGGALVPVHVENATGPT